MNEAVLIGKAFGAIACIVGLIATVIEAFAADVDRRMTTAQRLVALHRIIVYLVLFFVVMAVQYER